MAVIRQHTLLLISEFALMALYIDLSKPFRFKLFLQTFVFASKTGEKDAKTFVRYVEEEGPAYMAGLREGEMIFFMETTFHDAHLLIDGNPVHVLNSFKDVCESTVGSLLPWDS